MPPKRKNNLHLPPRVYHKHNAFYYLNKSNQWVRLGKNLPEAMRKYGEMMQGILTDSRMSSIIDRYIKEVASQKAETTYKGNIHAASLLRAAFGHLKPEEIRPVMIYKYMDIRRQTSVVGANKEKALLSHVFSYAIRWGLCEANPCINVKPLAEPKRRYEIPEADFWGFYQYAPPLIKIAMRIALITGLRLSDILNLQHGNLSDDGLTVETSKTGKKICFKWSNSLKQAVEEAKLLRGKVRSRYLLSTRYGQKYTADGFKSLWQRYMKNAVAQNIISQRFQFKDIRKKAATEIERMYGLEAAQKTLGHTTKKTTDSIYIVGTREVESININIKKRG